MKRDSFYAIADPTRREILDMLHAQPMNVNSVASNFETSRTAVYKHLKILKECGLIAVIPYGRERYCELQPTRLREVQRWVDQYSNFWNRKLDALDRHLEASKVKNRKPAKKKVK